MAEQELRQMFREIPVELHQRFCSGPSHREGISDYTYEMIRSFNLLNFNSSLHMSRDDMFGNRGGCQDTIYNCHVPPNNEQFDPG